MKKPKKHRQSFGKVYEKTVINGIPSRLTEQQVVAIPRLLHLKPGAKILDVGCGSGRHSIGLAKNDYKITGIDVSTHLIRVAQKNAKNTMLPNPPIFLQKNILALKTLNTFDAVVSILSFGFSKHERDHLVILKNTARALKKNGRILLTTVYLPQIAKILEEMKTYKGTTIFAHPDTQSLKNGVTETKQRSFDFETMIHTVTATLSKGKKILGHEGSSVRVFTLPEIKRLFETSGLKIEGLYSDFNREKLTAQSKRLVIVAKK